MGGRREGVQEVRWEEGGTLSKRKEKSPIRGKMFCTSENIIKR